MQKCPVCGLPDPDTDHLVQEYGEMEIATMFPRSAAAAQHEIGVMLLARGITHVRGIPIPGGQDSQPERMEA